MRPCESAKRFGEPARFSEGCRRRHAAAAALAANPAAAHAASAAPDAPHGNATAPTLAKAASGGCGVSRGRCNRRSPRLRFHGGCPEDSEFRIPLRQPRQFTFAVLHESLINYGGNKTPEFITCCHEESAVAMGHGYAKIEGKPLLVCVHGTVGLQHASMAIYDAFCDRVPVYIILGNFGDAASVSGKWTGRTARRTPRP